MKPAHKTTTAGQVVNPIPESTSEQTLSQYYKRKMMFDSLAKENKQTVEEWWNTKVWSITSTTWEEACYEAWKAGQKNV